MLIHFNLKGSPAHNTALLHRLRVHRSVVNVEVEPLANGVAQFRVTAMPDATAFAEVIAQELADHHNRLIETLESVRERIQEVNTML